MDSHATNAMSLPMHMQKILVEAIAKQEEEAVRGSYLETLELVKKYPEIAKQLWERHREACIRADRYCPELPADLYDRRVKYFYWEHLTFLEPYMPSEVSIVELHDNFCTQIDVMRHEANHFLNILKKRGDEARNAALDIYLEHQNES